MEQIIHDIRSDIEAVENDGSLYEETSFRRRSKALDVLEVDVIGRIEGLFLAEGPSEELRGLRHCAEAVKGQLEDVDEGLFQRLRAHIASGDYTSTALRQRIIDYAGSGSGEGNEGYDDLDAFVHGLLMIGTAPEETREREPEMVAYQPTPARIILELVEKADLQCDDVFYDIGSGLGRVAMLVHLLDGVRVKGVEVEPAYCEYARRCAGALNLSGVEFIQVDAREADCSDGTVFFLYTPCDGEMLEQVLRRLRDGSRGRSVRLYTYGPCTRQVARQRWLDRLDPNGDRVDRLAAFRTLE